MNKTYAFAILLFLITELSFGQSIGSLKLSDKEIPAGYKQAKELECETPHASSVYEQSDLFGSIMGKVVKKDFQSFEKKGDTGSILYFEFEKDFNGQGFLDGLLWGEGKKPTKSEPDEYYAKKNILVIWSFPFNSEIKKVSKEKVKKLLHG